MEIKQNDKSDQGDTLVEVLLALIILSICALALMMAFSSAITASSTQSRLVTRDAVLESASQTALSVIQNSAQSVYQTCTKAGSNQALVSYYNNYLAAFYNSYASTKGSEYSVTLASVQSWNGTSFSTACPTSTGEPAELLTINVKSSRSGQSKSIELVIGRMGGNAAAAANSKTTSITFTLANAFPVTYGAENAGFFTATVTGQAGAGYPIGSVVFENAQKIFCTSAGSGGAAGGAGITSTFQCALSAKELSGGAYANVYAVFLPAATSSSDPTVSYLPSTSPTLAPGFTVLATTATATISNLPVTQDMGTTYGAVVTTASDGVASVTSSTTAVCTVNGLTVTLLAPGTCTLTAHVAASANYLAVTGTVQSFKVSGTTSTTLSESASTLTYRAEQSEVFSVSVSGQTGAGYPVGIVTVKVGATTLCTVTLNAASLGKGTCSPSSTSLDTATNWNVIATFVPGAPSSSNTTFTYTGSTSSIRLLTVTRATVTASINAIANPTHPSTVTVSLNTLSNGLGQVVSSTPAVCTATGLSVTFVAAGSCTLIPSVAVATNYNAITAGTPYTFTVK